MDLTDFTILAANFNTTGKTFSQGNFNYDATRTVDLTDFTILVANFNKTLATAAAKLSAAPLAAPDRPTLSNAPAISQDDRLVTLLEE